MATETKPTKPLWTVRFALLSTAAYTQKQILDAFKPALLAAGYKVPQSPSVRHYTAKFKITTEGPFPDDDAKSVYETMTITGPGGKEVAQARDKTNDPPGTRPIVEKRLPVFTTVAWNIQPPATGNPPPSALADLIWQTRRTTLYDKATLLGSGVQPIADTWEKTPVKLQDYPDRPGIPASLLPPKPKPPAPAPEPKPEPAPAPAPTPAPAPGPAPVPWAGIVLGAFGLGGLVWLAGDRKRR